MMIPNNHQSLMLNTTIKTFLFLCCCITMALSGCNSSSSDPTTPATHNIVGTWSYTMISGNNTWDSGMFTFAGSAESGTYTQVNVYNVTYTGTYTVSGDKVTLDGSENFSGTFSDTSNLSGTWQSDDSSESGTWTAVKQ